MTFLKHPMLSAGIVAAALFAGATVRAADSTQVTVGVNKKLEATLYKPAGAGPFPALLVLHTSSGLRPADHQYAARLADEGYICLVPDFFTAYDLSQNNRQQTFTTLAKSIYEDLANALEVLKKTAGVRADAAGAIGFSNGGYWALLLAARKQVQAGVSYYGAINGAGTDNGLGAMRTAFNENSSPVLVLHGAQDTTVRVQFAESLIALLRDAKAPYEAQIYPSAGHSYERGRGDAEATADSWTRTLRFFGANLGKPAAPK